MGRGRARFGARFFRERFRKVRFWARFSSPFLHVFSGRCVFGHVFLHLFCTFFPEGAFLVTFFFTFSARFLARGFLGFPGVPYLFLQVFSIIWVIGALRGSWDVVTRVINKVTIIITA